MMASAGVLFVLLACLFSSAAPFSYEAHCRCRIRRRSSSLLLAKSGDVSTGDKGNRSKSREKWILIIEDDDNLRKAIGKFIAKEGGYSVTGVADARSGLLICRGIVRPNAKRSRFTFDSNFTDDTPRNATQISSRPDCLVLDVSNGIELMETMRADPALESLPVVLLTSSKVEERLAGYDSGADAYIAKPFDPNELTAVIEGLLLRNDRYRVSGDGTGREDQCQSGVYANLKRELSEIKELLEGLDDEPSPSKLDDSSGETSASSISQDIAGIKDIIESLNANGQPQSKSGDTAKRSYQYAPSILSPEDTEIMELVATGLSNNDIAAEMDCSVSKIEKRMTAMFKGARVRKRADLCEWWQMNQ